MNKAILGGKLTRDPELRSTRSGISVASFCIAVDDGKAEDGSRKAQFIDCVAWRGTADFVSKYFGKGDGIMCSGKITKRKYEDANGNTKYITEVIVESVEFGAGKSENRRDERPQPRKSADVLFGDELDDFIPLDDEGLPF